MNSWELKLLIFILSQPQVTSVHLQALRVIVRTAPTADAGTKFKVACMLTAQWNALTTAVWAKSGAVEDMKAAEYAVFSQKWKLFGDVFAPWLGFLNYPTLLGSAPPPGACASWLVDLSTLPAKYTDSPAAKALRQALPPGQYPNGFAFDGFEAVFLSQLVLGLVPPVEHSGGFLATHAASSDAKTAAQYSDTWEADVVSVYGRFRNVTSALSFESDAVKTKVAVSEPYWVHLSTVALPPFDGKPQPLILDFNAAKANIDDKGLAAKYGYYQTPSGAVLLCPKVKLSRHG